MPNHVGSWGGEVWRVSRRMLVAGPSRRNCGEYTNDNNRGRSMSSLLILTVVAVAIVLFFDYTNGFHDAANIVATIIASRAMTPAQAVIIVGTFEFLGPLLGGTAVANTIGKFVTLSDVGSKLCASSCANMLIRYSVDVFALWVTRRA